MNPQHLTAYCALLEVAKRESIPLARVIQSIEEGIQDAYSKSIAENNTAALSTWSSIPCEGTVPSAVELIAYLSALAASQ